MPCPMNAADNSGRAIRRTNMARECPLCGGCKPTDLAMPSGMPGQSVAPIELMGIRFDSGGLFLPIGGAHLQRRRVAGKVGGLGVRYRLRVVAGLLDGVGLGHLVGNWSGHDSRVLAGRVPASGARLGWPALSFEDAPPVSVNTVG